MPAPIPVGGIMSSRRLCLVGVMSVPDRPGIAARLFEALGSTRLNAQFIVHCIDLENQSQVQFCVAAVDRPRVEAAVGPVAEALGSARVIITEPVAMVSVFGPDFRERPGIAAQAFSALGEADINILAVSTSISTITCVVDDRLFETALAALHRVFELP
jgi:aspartokinase